MPWPFRHVPKAEATAALASVVVGSVLLVVKFVAYYLTGSAAIFSDALENIVNVVAACFAAYSLIVAHRPADEDHPYGHGKIEFLSAGLEGGMILLAALVIAARAIESFFRHAPVQNLENGLILIAITMVVNAILGLYLVRSGRQHRSLTLEADGKHLLTDAGTSVVVLVALAAVRATGWDLLDPIAATLMAVYIAYVGIGLMRRATAGLMDQQDINDDRLLRQILDSHLGPDGKSPLICSYHKLRHRHSGRYHWVDFHIMVPARWSIDTGHRVASSIEYEIELALGEGNATAHVEPCVDPGCEHCATQPDLATTSTTTTISQ